MTKQATKQDPHSRITDRILAELEKGTRPWLKPWSGGDMASGQTRPLRATGQPYRGINVLLLWIEAQAFGFVSPSWMTYRQAQALGAQVRKGESGATIVYYGDSSKTVRDETSGEDKEQGFRFLKTYTVFNVAQIDGLPERFHNIPEPAPEADRIEAAEAFFASIPATVNHGGDKAYYMPSADRIQLPPSRPSTMPTDITPQGAMKPCIGLGTRAALIVHSGAKNGAMLDMPARNWSLSLAQLSLPPTLALPLSRAPIMPAISQAG